MDSKRSKSPRQELRDNAEKVRTWPPYLRVYSTAYFKAKRHKSCHMQEDGRLDALVARNRGSGE